MTTKDLEVSFGAKNSNHQQTGKTKYRQSKVGTWRDHSSNATKNNRFENEIQRVHLVVLSAIEIYSRNDNFSLRCIEVGIGIENRLKNVKTEKYCKNYLTLHEVQVLQAQTKGCCSSRTNCFV